ncbi:transcriptional regulator with XRE-family HTH domain [Streptomyces canus]|uniref:Transcriptional regulator with XRE-family HTH domain n=2 Tax=Streptomyces canus TaxID=58343 RepID=A0AAW8FW39_9ACTN|nr:transcriptional regulator with XRE-family HTH domain [Streptomyces canus]
MCDMEIRGDAGPQQACDTAEFIAAMRELKERAGLTYRQLEERAAEHGEVLPRSTLADVLRGRTLPRPELLAAFVQACGDGERAAQWLAARDGLARGEVTGERGADPRRGVRLGARVFGVPVLPASGVLVALLAAAVWALVPSRDDGGSKGAGGGGLAAADARSLPKGHVQIRPALANGLCLTDGYSSRYKSLVAVQRPCDEVAPQETTLVPLGGNTFRIRWYHPDHGPGCLKDLAGGPGSGLLEPWDDCRKTTPFQIAPAGPDGSRRYSLRIDGRGCVAISDADTSEGAEAVVEPCRPKDSQVFVIRSAP